MLAPIEITAESARCKGPPPPPALLPVAVGEAAPAEQPDSTTESPLAIDLYCYKRKQVQDDGIGMTEFNVLIL